MGNKPRSPKKQTALLKIREGAADSELVQAIGHWHTLFGSHRLKMTFVPAGPRGRFRFRIHGREMMKKEDSYLIVDAVSGVFIGLVRAARAKSIGGKLPQAGRAYYLIRMGRV